jgi:hypothetical protein
VVPTALRPVVCPLPADESPEAVAPFLAEGADDPSHLPGALPVFLPDVDALVVAPGEAIDLVASILTIKKNLFFFVEKDLMNLVVLL